MFFTAKTAVSPSGGLYSWLRTSLRACAAARDLREGTICVFNECWKCCIGWLSRPFHFAFPWAHLPGEFRSLQDGMCHRMVIKLMLSHVDCKGTMLSTHVILLVDRSCHLLQSSLSQCSAQHLGISIEYYVWGRFQSCMIACCEQMCVFKAARRYYYIIVYFRT